MSESFEKTQPLSEVPYVEEDTSTTINRAIYEAKTSGSKVEFNVGDTLFVVEPNDSKDDVWRRFFDESSYYKLDKETFARKITSMKRSAEGLSTLFTQAGSDSFENIIKDPEFAANLVSLEADARMLRCMYDASRITK